MTPEVLLNSSLLANSALVAAVGARIYPLALPAEPTLPAVVFYRAQTEFISTIHSDEIKGEIATMHIYAMAASAAVAESTALQVRQALPAGMLRPMGQAAQYDPETNTFTTMLIAIVWAT